jgi:hypothetical protein
MYSKRFNDNDISFKYNRPSNKFESISPILLSYSLKKLKIIYQLNWQDLFSGEKHLFLDKKTHFLNIFD